jgi:hypothetical protein
MLHQLLARGIFCFGTHDATMSFHSDGVGISTNSIVPGPHLFKGFIHKLGRNSIG